MGANLAPLCRFPFIWGMVFTPWIINIHSWFTLNGGSSLTSRGRPLASPPASPRWEAAPKMSQNRALVALVHWYLSRCPTSKLWPSVCLFIINFTYKLSSILKMLLLYLIFILTSISHPLSFSTNNHQSLMQDSSASSPPRIASNVNKNYYLCQLGTEWYWDKFWNCEKVCNLEWERHWSATFTKEVSVPAQVTM